jgi:hypothetical protein
MATLITDMDFNRRVLHTSHPGSLNNKYCVKFINYIMNYFIVWGGFPKFSVLLRGAWTKGVLEPLL